MIHVTDYILARHEEILEAYERLGKTELARRDRMRLNNLKAIREHQDGKTYQQGALQV